MNIQTSQDAIKKETALIDEWCLRAHFELVLYNQIPTVAVKRALDRAVVRGEIFNFQGVGYGPSKPISL